ncbi:hypothetical protein SAMN04489712_105251 [Thermomonospora echinospora]|uniref:Uncharacterized protein n=1 Tax=Thermomonospora echinospora TaxID=1992 RepID=A0A1H6A9L5_9ACTN|nr:hypothetical protein [Thermomonospora echinospora]SEG44426.1 hypothetical protein SAMN04489712_105251 [Thermomonospora echinospora]
MAELDEQDRAMLDELGRDWNRVNWEPNPVRDPADEALSPTPEEMAEAPGAEQRTYRITYERVGRRGGRNGSEPPPPLTARVMSTDHLAVRIWEDVKPFLLSSDVEVSVDLESGRGQIFCGFNNGGSFAIERLDGQADG